MNLTPAPEILALKLQLSLDTHVDPYDFADWIRANLINLRDRLEHCDEPLDTDRRVENCQGIWLRLQFKARTVAA